MLKNSKFFIFDKDHKLMTPLHVAIIKGNTKLVQQLIDYGSDLEALDVSNRKPLYYAVKTG